MAILTNISSNHSQKFTVENVSFTCRPYGIITLDKLYKNSSIDSNCKRSIATFYKRNPRGKYYAEELLKIRQMYHIDFKKNKCLIYAKGQKTLSELLLEEGLALIKPDFEDEEYKGVFLQAQENAKINKNGVWKEDLLKKCVVELYK